MMGKKDTREAADMFKALGDPTRLKIYQFLRGRCWPHAADESAEGWLNNGPTVSEVCTKVTGSKKITSKVSQHLKELRLAGLVTIERRGKNMICGINQSVVHSLVSLLNSVEVVESAPLETIPAVEVVAIVEEPVKSRKKAATAEESVVELPVVEVELVKPRRKAKAAANHGPNSTPA
jgi:ArsR family transcriptional regulator, arsenate/arsenite/antimonite-responsive transcriptional repressor